MSKKLGLILMILVTNSVKAQIKSTWHTTIAGFQYLEVIKGYDAGKLPLLIAFHYSSSKPEETVADYDSLKTPVRIIIPRGNYEKRNGYSYYPSTYYKEDSLTQINLSKQTLDSLAGFVDIIEKKYDSKAVVSGISQGGDIAFLLAVYYPNLCKASFPFAGYIHSQLYNDIMRNPLNKVPVYIFQGEDDPIVPVSYSREAVKKLDKKLTLKLFTYPGVGHEISAKMKMDYSAIIDKINLQ